LIEGGDTSFEECLREFRTGMDTRLRDEALDTGVNFWFSHRIGNMGSELLKS